MLVNGSGRNGHISGTDIEDSVGFLGCFPPVTASPGFIWWSSTALFVYVFFGFKVCSCSSLFIKTFKFLPWSLVKVLFKRKNSTFIRLYAQMFNSILIWSLKWHEKFYFISATLHFKHKVEMFFFLDDHNPEVDRVEKSGI